ncbi:MAG: Zn-dependent oligopeptidase [bacterium]|nr:Zn-dependent oligopeptidase [bacterium]
MHPSLFARRLAVAAALSTMLLSAPAAGADQPATLGADTGMNWHVTPAQIKQSCDEAVAKTKAAISAAEALPLDQRTFQNAMLPIENAEASLTDDTAVDTVLYQLAAEKSLREASAACSQRVTDYSAVLNADPQIYATAARLQRADAAQSDADKALLRLYVVAGRRAAADLSDSKRAAATKLFQQIAELQRRFAINLQNDATTIVISQRDAASLPASLVATLKKTAHGYVVPVDESTVGRFMANERSAAARERFSVAYAKRGGRANVQLLQQAVAQRDRLAHVLGFQTWAGYQLSNKMAQSPAKVNAFLTQIDAKLLPKARREEARLAALKRAQGVTTPFESWDYSFYENQLRKTAYAVDDQQVRRYFPIDHVITSVLAIYERLLGVTFNEITPADAWAPGVREFSIANTADGKAIGWFYLDLFPRPGKFSHFANFPLRIGRLLPDGTFQRPVAAIVGNWPQPAPGKQALLNHDDVITFFHEFGHLMHATLCTAPYETTNSMEGVEQDFIEAPSQMLENWMWQPEILAQVSSNVNTGQPLPDELIAKMVALKHIDDGITWTTQAFYAAYDMTIHSSGPEVPATKIWAALKRKMTVFPMVPGTYPEAGFEHLMGGYDAGYYGYLWSKVYAQDMFTVFQRGGLESPAVGARYREDILEPGAIYPAQELVEKFLGRPLSYEAFYRDLGIAP